MMKTAALAIGLLFAAPALAQQPAQPSGATPTQTQPGQAMMTLSGPQQQPQQTGLQPSPAQPQAQPGQPDKLQAARQQIEQQVRQLEEQVKSLQAQLQADQQLLTRMQQIHQALQ